MKYLDSFHPLSFFIYFICELILIVFVSNPVIEIIAIIGAILFLFFRLQIRELFNDLIFYIVLLLLVTITNPIFSHNGKTPLFFLNGNPITKEAFIYGFYLGLLIIAVIIWFKIYNIIMTSDKFILLFGKVIPKISLLLSMVLRFVPMLIKQYSKVKNTQKAIGYYSEKSYSDRFISSIKTFMTIISWAFEISIETHYSMKCRGYGLKNKTNYATSKIKSKDYFLIISTFIIFIFVLVAISFNILDFNYYPVTSNVRFDINALITYFVFLILSILPFILELKEELLWKYYISKI